jgi:hypothetical protein
MKKIAFTLVTCVLSLAVMAQDPAARFKDKILPVNRLSKAPHSPGAGTPLARAAAVCQLDSQYTRYWITSTNAWSDFSRTIYYYDSKFNCTLENRSSSFSGSWTPSGRLVRNFDANSNVLLLQQDYWSYPGQYYPSSRQTYTYNGQGLEVMSLGESWMSQTSVWQPNYSVERNYDANGNMILYLWRVWNQNALENSSRSTFTFSSNKNITQEIYESWSTSLNSWQNSSLANYSYDIFGNLLTGTLQAWNGSAWVKDARFAATYANNLMSTAVLEAWDPVAGIWVKDQKYSFTYDASGNNLEELDQWWDKQLNAWVNDYRYKSTYDGNNNQASWSEEEWDAPSAKWKFRYTWSALYDSKNNITYQLEKNCSSLNGTCVNSYESSWYYNCTTAGLEARSAMNAALSLYPNPASGNLTLCHEDGARLILVTDITGKILISAPFKGNLDVSSLVSGLYLLRVISENGEVNSAKFVKE